jgi:hypothetical protein
MSTDNNNNDKQEQEAIEFPATTSLVIGVNEIQPGAGEIEH